VRDRGDSDVLPMVKRKLLRCRKGQRMLLWWRVWNLRARGSEICGCQDEVLRRWRIEGAQANGLASTRLARAKQRGPPPCIEHQSYHLTSYPTPYDTIPPLSMRTPRATDTPKHETDNTLCIPTLPDANSPAEGLEDNDAEVSDKKMNAKQ
jgi:hypothetical protein